MRSPRQRSSIALVHISLRGSVEIYQDTELGILTDFLLLFYFNVFYLTLFVSFSSFVEIAIEAMDQLLLTCHSLNLFVQSYLKVVQLVLESHDVDLQVLATMSVRNCGLLIV